MVADDAFMFQQ